LKSGIFGSDGVSDLSKNKVQSGEKKLRYGGLVGIDRMTRSLREF